MVHRDTIDERKEFADILYAARQELGWTTKEAAANLGIGKNTFWLYESAQRVIPAYVIKRILKLKEEAK